MSIDKIKEKLAQTSLKDNSWLEKAKWQEENEDWLDISFSIAVKVLSALRTNKKTDVFPRSQKELAEAMGCSAQYVNKLVRGQENLQIETICKIQRILNVTLIEVPKYTQSQTYNAKRFDVIVGKIDHRAYNANTFEVFNEFVA